MVENRHLLLPYAAPYFAYVLIASLLQEVTSMEFNYLLRIIAATGLLIWGWQWYIPLSGEKSIASSFFSGLLFGLAGTVLWIGLLLPFVHAEDGSPWTTTGFVLRLFAAGLLVPFFEELMIRGFGFRLALQWSQCRTSGEAEPLRTAMHERSIDDVQPGQWSWAAVLLSTFVFMIGHAISEWPAAIAYSLLLSVLLIKQKDILACIIAHSVTNLTLAAYIFLTDSWQLW